METSVYLVRLASRRHLEFAFVRNQASHGPEKKLHMECQEVYTAGLYNHEIS